MAARILLVEDDDHLTELIRYNLAKAGYVVHHCADGDDAVMIAEEETPDLIILDWMLPNVSGIELCRQFRRHPALKDTPIIMLTARAEEADRVRGLDTGADVYVTKPFSPREFSARINALLRRAKPSLAGAALSHGDLVLEPLTHKARRAGRTLKLGPTEFRMLRHFMETPGRVFSRQQLLDAVWGRDVYVEERTVDVHIRRLRKAINGPGEPDLIRTVRSAGYALDDPD